MSSSDADFSSEVELSITIPESELRGARDEIESSIGSVPVSTDGGRATAGAGGRRLRPRFVRQNLRGQVNRLGEIETQGERRNRLIEELLEAVGGGTGGGGGGGGDILGDFVGDFGGEVAGDAVDTATDIATDLQDSLTDAISTGLGNFAGNVAADLLTGGGGGSATVEKPDWVPLQVEEPPPIPVEDVGPISISVGGAGTGVTATPEPGFMVPPDARSGDPETKQREPLGRLLANIVGSIPGGGAINDFDRTVTNTIRRTGRDLGLPGGKAPIEDRDAGKSGDGGNQSARPVSPFVPGRSGSGGRRPSGGGAGVVVYNEVDVGPTQREVERIIEDELDRFERRLERRVSSSGR